MLKPTGTFWLNLGDTYGTHTSKRSGQFGKDIKKGFDDVFTRSRPREGFSPNFVMEKNLLGIPWRVVLALHDDGWILRNDICWYKPNAMPSSVKDRLTCAYEHVFLFAKQRRYYFDLDAIRKPHSQPDALTKKHGSITRGGKPRQTPEASGYELKSNPLGKNPGNVWKAEDEKLTKHDIAVGRIGNFSYTDPLHTKEYHPKGKNPGDLWRIPTMPFPGAHFATFPPALIEPIVKAGSSRWVCSRCGKPRTRITKNPLYEKIKIDNWTKMEDEKIDKYDSKFSERQGIHSQSRSLGAYRNWLREHGLDEFESGAPTETVGWSDCGCGEKWMPGIVMDPFGGSGTVGRVAHRLGRSFIILEIKPEYTEMAHQRIRGKYKPLPEGAVTLDQFMETEK